MTKAKYFFIAFIMCILLLIIPNYTNAATEQTYNDTKQGIQWSYELDNAGYVINLKCNTKSKTGSVTIPSTIDGKTVISLNGDWYDGAFQNCAGITAITIPNTITSIGEDAFSKCTGLKSVTIPDSVTSIDSSAFRYCSGITSITLSKNLTSIGSYAFSDCTGLKSITIPDSVTTIGENAFKNCSGLKSVTLSKNLTKISQSTFEACSGLTSIVIPDSVTTIEGPYSNIYGAFDDCTNLQKVLIPDTVASIGESAFHGCSKLTIYGNDGMASKTYAEKHEIPFDYIKNWDKASSGADITPPTVDSIVVTYGSVMSYSKDSNKNMYIVPANAKLAINVNFNEVVTGSTVPTLTIKFGDGSNIKVTEGTVGGSTITYIYTVKSSDKGVLTTVDFSGGNIKDAAGNAAKLSCPALKVQYSSGEFVYANGTVSNVDNNSSSNNASSGLNSSSTDKNSENSNNKGTNTNNSATSNSSSSTKDTTVANTKIPQTGVGIGIFVCIFIVISIAILFYRKYNMFKDIK